MRDTKRSRSAGPRRGGDGGGRAVPWAWMLLTSLVLAAVAGPSAAAPSGESSPSYFPLHEGDRWVYVLTEGWPSDLPAPPPVVVEVTTSYVHQGSRIFVMENYGFPMDSGALGFYRDRSGNTVELRADASGLWYPWRDRAKVVLPELAIDCIHGHRGAFDEQAEVGAVAAGTAINALTIRYDYQPCADSGMVRETFALGIGLIERRVLSFLGEHTWSLQSALIDDIPFGDRGATPAGAAGVMVLPGPTPAQPSTWGAIKAAFQR